VTDLPSVKLKTVVPVFPTNVSGGVGIEITRETGRVAVDMAWDEFPVDTDIPTSPTSNVLTFDTATEEYRMVPTLLLGGGVPGDRRHAGAGDHRGGLRRNCRTWC
jgi:hypothetical protein